MTPTCTCEFADGNKLTIVPNTEGNDALAGTVGALSSLLVAASGLGLWCFCTKWKKRQPGMFRRSSTNRSNQSEGKDSYDPNNPTPYSEFPRKRPETIPPLENATPLPKMVQNSNVYRAADNLNMRVGSRLSTSLSQYNGTRSDWM